MPHPVRNRLIVGMSMPSHVVLCDIRNTSSTLNPDTIEICKSERIPAGPFAISRATIGGTSCDVCQKFRRTLRFFMDYFLGAAFSRDAARCADVAGTNPARCSNWALIVSGASL